MYTMSKLSDENSIVAKLSDENSRGQILAKISERVNLQGSVHV